MRVLRPEHNMADKIILQAPIEVEVKVAITDGENEGEATIRVTRGRYPSEDDVRETVRKFAEAGMPDGFRLMTKREWFDTVVPPAREEEEDGTITLMPFALPGGDDWDE